MSRKVKTAVVLSSVFALWAGCASPVLANGGPFVIKYPSGDPAAKGGLARLHPDLKPGRETRLKVIKEDLKVTFGKDGVGREGGVSGPPLARVSAEYTIHNPTAEQIEVDFGFPIIRGIYISPFAMMPSPDVQVHLEKTRINCTVISNSAIYGIIRQRAREMIEKALAEDRDLWQLAESVRSTEGKAFAAARKALQSHLTNAMKWNERDAALMVEYASLDFGQMKSHPPDRIGWWGGDKGLAELMNASLGSLSAIGEQKATQFFAQLASCFDPQAGAGYEAIFTAWGGDVREQSVDMATGKVRPREITVDRDMLTKPAHHPFGSSPMDPTIYARVDYLDSDAKISESERASCTAILKNLPVIFTFAPMNILHYQVQFPANSTQTLTVSYSQFAYLDTRSPSSYQLAYVVHPASLWEDFGPINLEVAVPERVAFRASVPCTNGGVEERPLSSYRSEKGQFTIYQAGLEQKTGELYLAVDATAWRQVAGKLAGSNSDNDLQQLAQRVWR